MVRYTRTLLAAAIFGLGGFCAPKAHAAQLAGVTLPNTAVVGSQVLLLNGIGLRTYSILHVHVYVAGLYLTHPMDNADAILQSPAPKILRLHFVHDVNASSVRQAWKMGLTDNCVDPCRLNNAELNQFLNSLQPISAGEDIMFVFKDYGLDAYENGQHIGHITDPEFARLILAVFIGPHVRTPALKSELLGLDTTQSS
ncbi:MAG TPA: chalcone isomerase family protein [Acidocella sp.]|nr:chalcone isomerase family protein [Acidocella sp.]